jgi:D-galactose 1-dehydrogenase
MFNIGIIGLGHVARHHISALNQSEKYLLIAACDSYPSRFAVFDRSIKTFTDVDEFLSLSELDVVVVSSPNSLHIEHGIKVMSAGKWLLMEKPLAESQADFDKFVKSRDLLSGKCTLALHAAFGVETAWFFDVCDNQSLGAGEISSFAAQFYDPYFSGQSLEKRAISLGGSWMDSGINALSVICRLIDPEQLLITDSRMTRVLTSRCTEVQGTVDFRFRQNLRHGFGSIDTNWTIGRDSKITTLSVATADHQIILDHSAQQVILRNGASDRIIFSCENDHPRLTNHYIGVFRDLAIQLEGGFDNFEYCQALHRILFDAEDWMT